MKTKRKKILAILAMILLSFWFSFFWYRADVCAHTESCGSYRESYSEAHKGIISRSGNVGVTDDALSLYTFWLMIFTGALALATGTQGYLLVRAERVALKLAKSTRRQVRLARKEFTASHRPRLYVRNVVIGPMSDPVKVAGISSPIGTGEIRGKFLVANRGDSRAYITECYARVHLSEIILPMKRPYEDVQVVGLSDVVESGRAEWYVINDGVILSPEQASAVAKGMRLRMYAMGWVQYRDASGVERRTAFCRQYDPQRGRFYAVDDPDYEHEE